jgi:hypothetical protein
VAETMPHAVAVICRAEAGQWRDELVWMPVVWVGLVGGGGRLPRGVTA